MKKFAIIRYNPEIDHRYVHSNCGKTKLYRDRVKAELERSRMCRFIPSRDVEIIAVDNPAQAREYCRLRGEGMDHETALKEAMA